MIQKNIIYTNNLNKSSYLLCLKVLSLIFYNTNISIQEKYGPKPLSSISAFSNSENSMFRSPEDIMSKFSELFNKIATELKNELVTVDETNEPSKLILKFVDSFSLDDNIKRLLDIINRELCYENFIEITICGEVTKEQEDALSRVFPMLTFNFC